MKFKNLNQFAPISDHKAFLQKAVSVEHEDVSFVARTPVSRSTVDIHEIIRKTKHSRGKQGTGELNLTNETGKTKMNITHAGQETIKIR